MDEILEYLKWNQVSSLIKDEQVTKGYCLKCAKGNKHVQTCEPFNIIRNLGSVTSHPRDDVCKINYITMPNFLCVSYTSSLPVFNLFGQVFDKFALAHSLGYPEQNICKENLELPEFCVS